MTKLGKIGPYTLLERVGRGGMGEVYLATTRRGDHVAVKVLHDLVEDDSSRIRLEREVRALRRVESPYVAKVLDADLQCARPYLVMEHIDGDTLLDQVRRSGPIGGVDLVDMAQAIATALAIIHAAGVVHRDLKPANILMGEEGPVLIDFGIAQVHDATRLTMTGTFLGTPGYAAPELFADEHVDSPADVHAWAATVAFAATGRPTFGRGTLEAQMYAVMNGQADLKGVPASLLPLIRAALNREPAKRPTAALLADRLSRLARATAARASAATEEADVDEAPGKPRRSRVEAEVPPPRGRPSPEAGTAARSRTVSPGEGAAARSRTAPSGEGAAVRSRTAPAGAGRPAPGDGKKRAVDGKLVAGAKRSGPATGEKPLPTGKRVATTTKRPAAKRTAALKAEGATTALPAGNVALLLLAVLAVPCVVATVIWPVATFGVTGALILVTRTFWAGHWLVRKRKSRKMRISLRVLSFPLVLAVTAVTVVVWPGLPVAAVAAGTLWATAGGELGYDWWQQTAPVTAAGVVFGVLCGGIVGREIERVGLALPLLRKEGLRALAVLGGFVALCTAAVRAIALLL